MLFIAILKLESDCDRVGEGESGMGMGDLASLNVKKMLRRRRVLVCHLSSRILVRRYSPDRMAKNIAPIHNWEIAMFSTVVFSCGFL